MNKKITKQISSKTLLCGIAIFAASFAAMNGQAQTYNVGDIAVINNIIDSNGLNWTKANPADGSYIPADWTDCEWTDDAANKRIISLNVSEYNLIGLLDVSGLENLKELYCGYNKLTALNVSGLENLEILNCNMSELTALNVSEFKKLQGLWCAWNQLTVLDVSELKKLQWLQCNNNLLTVLDVSGLVNLETFSCGNNEFTALNVSGLEKLQRFWCDNNYLTELDLTGLNSLDEFEGENQSVSLTLKGSGTNYTAAIALNSPTPTIFAAGITYNSGILTSNSKTIASSDFEVQTGLAGKTLSGTLNFTYEEISGISEIESASVKIYPNPVKDELKIESGDLTIKKVEILDVTGKVVGNSINVSALSQGIYFVKIETDKGIITRKLVKE